MLGAPGLGQGEPDLGEKLMTSFLSVLLESGRLPARIICINSGIFLTTEGASVAAILARFAEQGTDVVSCGTCLDYFDRRDKLIVGRVGNMKETVESMLSHRKILSP